VGRYPVETEGLYFLGSTDTSSLMVLNTCKRKRTRVSVADKRQDTAFDLLLCYAHRHTSGHACWWFALVADGVSMLPY
jgi:hypothetical protein